MFVTININTDTFPDFILGALHYSVMHLSLKNSFFVLFLITSPMCGADAEASHLAWQRSVSIAAIVSIKSCRVVVLSVPGSIPVPIAVAVVGFGVSVIQVSGLRSLWGLGLRSV